MAPHSYVQLSLRERDRIAAFRVQGLSLREIARRLRRTASTISRELKRNRAPVYNAYGAANAEKRARARKRAAGRRPRLKSARLRAYVCARLKEGWSPEQIAGRLKRMQSPLRVSYEAIYQYIYTPSVRKEENLVSYLARAHRRRQLKGHRHTHRDLHIPERISIKKRPTRVNSRRQFGHWERDGVETHKGRSALNVLVERKSRLVKIQKLPAQTALEVSRAVSGALKRLPRGMRRSLTYDNGSENVRHRQTNAKLGTRSYFCEPYHSWEKGTVENTIGLIRRTLPKATNFDLVTPGIVKQIERCLNSRPRKRLHFATPLEIFQCGVALTR